MLYCFTVYNTKRLFIQKKAFQKACVDAVKELANRDAELLVIGNTQSHNFPKELMPYTKRTKFGAGKIKVNFLVNYGWDRGLKQTGGVAILTLPHLIDYPMGGRMRLRGFLPI